MGDDDAPGLDAFGPTVTSAMEGVALDDAHLPLAPEGAERFRELRPLGRGGMGEVVEARDDMFGRRVALKRMLRPRGPGRTRFMAESIVTANLEHPGIPSVYARGVDAEGRPFYAMQLVRGRTLAEAIDDADDLEARLKLVPIVARVAQTLAYAHERGVVHRDIKPANVVVGRHGETVLLDWGIAKVQGGPTLGPTRETTPLEDGTQMGMVIGTPAYMAPEQARGQVDRIDARTDVFALGAMLYQCLTGRAPFAREGTDPITLAREAKITPLVSLSPDAPPALRAIVEHAMAREPSERHDSAGDFAAALDDYIAASLVGRADPRVERVATTLAVLALAFVVFASVMVWRHGPGLAALGVGAWGFVGLTVVGLVFSLIEWRTQQRHGLSRLALATAAATLLLGVAQAFTGLGIVLAAVSEQMSAPTVDVPPNQLLLLGTHEAMGNIAPAAVLTALQLVAWALLTRRGPTT